MAWPGSCIKFGIDFLHCLPVPQLGLTSKHAATSFIYILRLFLVNEVAIYFSSEASKT